MVIRYLPSMHLPKTEKSFNALLGTPLLPIFATAKQKCENIAESVQMCRKMSFFINNLLLLGLIRRRKLICKNGFIRVLIYWEIRVRQTYIFLPGLEIMIHRIFQVLQRVRIVDGEREIGDQ